MENINVENKARYTAIYFAGDEVGAIYVGVKIRKENRLIL